MYYGSIRWVRGWQREKNVGGSFLVPRADDLLGSSKRIWQPPGRGEDSVLEKASTLKSRLPCIPFRALKTALGACALHKWAVTKACRHPRLDVQLGGSLTPAETVKVLLKFFLFPFLARPFLDSGPPSVTGLPEWSLRGSTKRPRPSLRCTSYLDR